MEKEITLDLVRVTEAAALKSSIFLGRGDKEAVDREAVDAMRGMLDYVPIQGTVVIGEGEKDQAPMLFLGEQVGNWDPNSPEVDIAVDPIDGTRLVAFGLPNAISVVAASDKGGLASLPTFYCNKIACGPELTGKLDINASVRENLRVAAAVLGVDVTELVVAILNRERHRELINNVREVGARIKLLGDGDIAASIATAVEGSGIDLYMGVGGSPEGVLAAAALRSLEGEIQMTLWPQDEAETNYLNENGHNTDRVFFTKDLAGGKNVIFAATGVTDGDFLRGVVYKRSKVTTHSIVMRSISRTVRRIVAEHDLRFKVLPSKSSGKDLLLIE